MDIAQYRQVVSSLVSELDTIVSYEAASKLSMVKIHLTVSARYMTAWPFRSNARTSMILARMA